jgi:hypothetical protein
MKVGVGFPWRATPERDPVANFVWDWWRETLPDAEIFTADTGHQPFNLNAARNEVVRSAELFDVDVVIICDADVILSNVDSLHAAIDFSWARGTMAKPHSVQRYLTQDETERLMAGEHDDLSTDRHGDGAIFVVQPKQWWAMHGADERFIGWGDDDRQIVMTAETFIGLTWFTGNALTLWHADEHRPIGSPAQERNARLANAYRQLRFHPKEMLKFIETRPLGWEGTGGQE